MMTLSELRDQWETGNVVPIATFGNPERDYALIVVGKYTNPNNVTKYSVLRYFMIRENWVVSCDVNHGTAEEAFAALERGVDILLG